MMKKFMYHGAFATLGISLLLGMSVLQAKQQPADQLLDDSAAVSEQPAEASAETTPAVPDVTAAAPSTPAAEPIQVASLPASTPAPSVAPRIKNPLEDATAFSVFDTAHKSDTKKNFKASTKDLHKAKAYYERLVARHHKHAVIKAQVNDEWVSVSAKDFNSYIKSR